MNDTIGLNNVSLPESADGSNNRSISSKGAVLAVAQALGADPSTDTSVIEGLSEFDEIRDKEKAADYVRNKAERYAIAAVIVDRAIDDMVTSPNDPRQAQFIDLPDATDRDVQSAIAYMGESTVGFDSKNPSLTSLQNDIAASVSFTASRFSQEHPELAPAVRRYESISIADPFDVELNTGRKVIENTLDTLKFLVLDEFIPLTQRLFYESKHDDLVTPEQRLEAAKDLAQKIIFDTAALNLGHFQHISDAQSVWYGFDFGDNLQADIKRGKSGAWTMSYVEGHQKPPKPKSGLAGETFGCPALVRLEADDTGSPLHRLVYATLNEAGSRGLFSDQALEANKLRLEAVEIDRERLETERAKFMQDYSYARELDPHITYGSFSAEQHANASVADLVTAGYSTDK